jgi:hypothetical protein
MIADGDPQADGVQQDVTVKSTFFAADVTLTVVDRDDAKRWRRSPARTDDDGNFDLRRRHDPGRRRHAAGRGRRRPVRLR